MRVEHNLGDVSEIMRRGGAAVEASVRRALRRIGIAVERQATKNVTGKGAPGAWPVPRRTGFLARSITAPIIGRNSVSVESVAEYAGAMTFGFHAFGNPNAPYYPGRPYMYLAANSVDGAAILVEELERAP